MINFDSGVWAGFLNQVPVMVVAILSALSAIFVARYTKKGEIEKELALKKVEIITDVISLLTIEENILGSIISCLNEIKTKEALGERINILIGSANHYQKLEENMHMISKAFVFVDYSNWHSCPLDYLYSFCDTISYIQRLGKEKGYTLYSDLTDEEFATIQDKSNKCVHNFIQARECHIANRVLLKDVLAKDKAIKKFLYK